MPPKSHTPHRTIHSPKLDLSFCPLSQFTVKDAKAPFIITPHKTFSRYAIHQYSEQLRLITANRIPKTTWNTLQFSHNSLTYIATLIALYRNKTPVALINQRTPPKKVTHLIRHVLNSTTYIGKLTKNDLPPALTYLAEKTLTTALTTAIKKIDLNKIDFNESTANKTHTPIEPIKPIKPIPIASHLPLEIIFTSGTTSTPNKPSAKAVVYSLADLVKSAATSNDLLNFTAKKKWYLSLPLYHISGLSILFRTLVAGASLYLDESNHFSPHTVLTAIEKHCITHLSLVSAQLLELLTLPKASAILKKCDVILVGGSFIDVYKRQTLGCSTDFSLTAEHLPIFEESSLLYIEGYLLENPSTTSAVRKAISMAKAVSIPIALSASNYMTIERNAAVFNELIPHVDILFVNEDELKKLCEVQNHSTALKKIDFKQSSYPDLMLELGHAFKRRGLFLIATAGKHGSYLWDSRESLVTEPVYIEAIATEVVDTTGAGDAYAAGILNGILEHAPLQAMGNQAATLASKVISRFSARY